MDNKYSKDANIIAFNSPLGCGASVGTDKDSVCKEGSYCNMCVSISYLRDRVNKEARELEELKHHIKTVLRLG